MTFAKIDIIRAVTARNTRQLRYVLQRRSSRFVRDQADQGQGSTAIAIMIRAVGQPGQLMRERGIDPLQSGRLHLLHHVGWLRALASERDRSLCIVSGHFLDLFAYPANGVQRGHPVLWKFIAIRAALKGPHLGRFWLGNSRSLPNQYEPP